MQEPIPFGGYTLVKRLAVSSMSEVYLAFPEGRERSGSPVIVKRILDEVAVVDAFVNLFHNEAELASFMEHPNIVRFLDVGESDGLPFLVMEYVDGMDLWRLTRRLRRDGQRLPPVEGIYIITEVLKALAYVHALVDEEGTALEIVHHDVSPSNIMLGMDGRVKLGDFGIAYSEQNLENFGRKFKGKVYYLSPEQVRGVGVDHRSDLYSAGVVLAELVIGKRPFTGPTDLSILINVRDRHSPVLDEALRTLPASTAEVIDRALRTSPDERFPDADSFRRALQETLKPGDMERASRDLPRTLASVRRSTDGVKGIRMRRNSGVDLYRAIATPLPAEPGTLAAEEDTEEEEGNPYTPITPIRMVTDYEVRKADGTVMGTLPLSAVIEAIVLGRLMEEDVVSVAGGEFLPVMQIPELAKHLPSITPTERRHSLGPPDIRGILGDRPAAMIFLDMHLAGETGLLHFECSGIRKDIYIERGVPRHVSSNVSSELLGEYLVRNGSISRMELDMALAVMDRFEGRLGDTLLGLDIIDSITLLRNITVQVKERLFDLFTWQEGEFQFYRNAEHVREDFRLSVHPLELIKEGCLRALEREDMEAWFHKHGQSVLRLNEEAEVPFDEWKFAPTYRLLLDDLARGRSLVEIMQPYAHSSPEVRGKLLRVLKFGSMVGFITGLERESLNVLP